MSNYPTHGGEVCRDYLLHIAKTCYYPNLAYELALHPYSVATAAAHAEISMDILMDVLRGDDELLTSEARGLLWFASQYSDEKVSYVYLFSRELTIVDTRLPENAARVENALKELKALKRPHALIRSLLRGNEIPEAAIACAHKHYNAALEEDHLRNHKPRTKRLCELLDAEEVLSK